jgi:WD40 repeat protein
MTAWQTFLGRLIGPRKEEKQTVAPQLTGDRRAQDASDGLPAEPMLRIETGLHGGQIRGIDTDAKNRFAVTASDDKTVRVWSLPDGRLLRVLRLPIDFGDIGKANAVAISPDGDTVATAGWTWTNRLLQNNIFLFNRASGELTKRLTPLPHAVLHLAYSPDGQRLAASLAINGGIRVFDAGNGYRPLPSDTQYNNWSHWASFDRAGRLVTTSYDGFLRLYAAERYVDPIAHFRFNGELVAAAFSPDGTRVAVCFDNVPRVVVYLSQLGFAPS